MLEVSVMSTSNSAQRHASHFAANFGHAIRVAAVAFTASLISPAAVAQFSISSVDNDTIGIFQGGLEISDLPASDSRDGIGTMVSYDPDTFTLFVDTSGSSGGNHWLLHADGRFRFRSTGSATGSDAPGGTSSFRIWRPGPTALFGSECGCLLEQAAAVVSPSGEACIPEPGLVDCCIQPHPLVPEAALHLAPGEPRYLVPMVGGQPNFSNICAVMGRGHLDLSSALDFDLELPGGTWMVSVGAGQAAAINVSWSAQLLAPPIPPDEEVFFWEGFTGGFDIPANWEPEGVPGEGDLAIFDKDQQYTVIFGAEESGRAWVERGFVAFSGGSYTLGGGSDETPSFIVGNDAGDTAGVGLANGHMLETTFATLGREANNEGRVVIGSALGAPAEWKNQGRLTVGEAGKGEIVAEPGTKLTSDELIIAALPGSRGEIDILAGGNENNPSAVFGTTVVGLGGLGEVSLDGSSMQTGPAIFGVEADANGFGFVINSAWDAERFELGGHGGGILGVSQGGEVSTPDDSIDNINVLAREAGSFGSLQLVDTTTLAVLPLLLIGQEGEGEVIISEQAALLTDTAILGAEGEGRGSIRVQTGGGLNATLFDVGSVSVGSGGAGPNLLKIESGGSAAMVQLDVGSSPLSGSNNLVIVDAGELTVSDKLRLGTFAKSAGAEGHLLLRNGGQVKTDQLTVAAGSGLHGAGVIEVTGTEPAQINGLISSGVMITGIAQEGKQADPLFGRGRGFDTLTIQGDVMGDGSVIVMSVGGEQGGLQDRLIIEGDASFEDVTLKLEFKYGYAPQAGDTIPLIEVMGDGSVMPASLEFLGLEEGFDFDIEIPGDGSVIQMRALSDGIPTSFRAEDLNEDGQVNAVDVQLVINGALGLSDPLETDVNFDKVTNAVDVQLVINAALGL